MRRFPLIAALVVIAGCGREQPANDTATVLPVDTLKPLVVDSAPGDSVAALPPATTGTSTRTPATKTTRPTTIKRDSLSPNIGRDSVIRRRPGRMPATDTNTKRP